MLALKMRTTIKAQGDEDGEAHNLAAVAVGTETEGEVVTIKKRARRLRPRQVQMPRMQLLLQSLPQYHQRTTTTQMPKSALFAPPPSSTPQSRLVTTVHAISALFG